VNNEVLASFSAAAGQPPVPLTQHRSKPASRSAAVPPDRHPGQQTVCTRTSDEFSCWRSQTRVAEPAHRSGVPHGSVHQGFVEILAAEQTPDNPNWYQGTADAVRRRAHFSATTPTTT
jgi:glucose-1-phosphate adenylyltransferase